MVLRQGGRMDDGFGTPGQLDIGSGPRAVTTLDVLAGERRDGFTAYQEKLSAALHAELDGHHDQAVAEGILLTIGHDKTWAEAAAATGVPPEALRKRVGRALPAIRARVLDAVGPRPADAKVR